MSAAYAEAPKWATVAFGLARKISALIAVIFLAGCASTPPWPASESPGERPPRIILQDVPFYPQEQYQCGPASLATVLNAQGLTTHPEQLKDQVYIPGRQGSLQVEMVATARSHGMLVYPLEPKIASILEEVAAGNPVLVMQNLQLDWWPQWHFAVVTGYDQHQESLILNTDTREQYVMPYKAFHATWNRAERWAVVVLPPERLPATAERLPFLRAAHDLESTQQTDAAFAAYRTAEQHWQNHPAPLMAQGNLTFNQGNTTEALQHFKHVVSLFPDYAAGWNNLAYALTEAGCPDTGKRAMNCARQLDASRFGNAQNTKSAVVPGPEPHCTSLPTCPVPENR